MNFLADEGLDRTLVLRLRELGHSVDYAAEIFSGCTDVELLRVASENQQIILTKDKDFGELVFKRMRECEGVVLIRLESMTSKDRTNFVLEWFYRLNWDLHRKFTTLTSTHARMVELSSD